MEYTVIGIRKGDPFVARNCYMKSTNSNFKARETTKRCGHFCDVLYFSLCRRATKQGSGSIWRRWLTSIRIPIIRIRRSQDRLIFMMEISIPGKMVFRFRRRLGGFWFLPGPSVCLLVTGMCRQVITNGTIVIVNMMTSSDGNIFRVTGPLCGEFTGHRRIPRIRASDAEIWCFLWPAPE